MCCFLGGFLGILMIRTIVHQIGEKYKVDFYYQPAAYQRRYSSRCACQ
jgi:hypothetical protein